MKPSRIINSLVSRILTALTLSLSPAFAADVPPPLQGYSPAVVNSVNETAQGFGKAYCGAMDSINRGTANTSAQSCSKFMQSESKIYSQLCAQSDVGATAYVGFKEQSQLEAALVDYFGTYDLALAAYFAQYNCGLITFNSYTMLKNGLVTWREVSNPIRLLKKDGIDQSVAAKYVSDWSSYTKALVKEKRQ